MYFILSNIRQTATPAMSSTKNSIAAPEPFPYPKSILRNGRGLVSIIGANTLSTRNPPRKYPRGIEYALIAF